MPNIVQNYNETTNDPEYPLTYEEAILDPTGAPIKGYVKEAVVAPQYDPTTGTYAVGDPVMDDKKYYRCNTAVPTPEDFDPTKWTEKTISEEIDGLNQNLTKNGIVSGTTDSNGYVTTNINTSSRIILGACIEGVANNRVVTPFTNNSVYTMLVTNAQFVAVASQNVTIKYVYVDA